MTVERSGTDLVRTRAKLTWLMVLVSLLASVGVFAPAATGAAAAVVDPGDLEPIDRGNLGGDVFGDSVAKVKASLRDSVHGETFGQHPLSIDGADNFGTKYVTYEVMAEPGASPEVQLNITNFDVPDGTRTTGTIRATYSAPGASTVYVDSQKFSCASKTIVSGFSCALDKIVVHDGGTFSISLEIAPPPGVGSRATFQWDVTIEFTQGETGGPLCTKGDVVGGLYWAGPHGIFAPSVNDTASDFLLVWGDQDGSASNGADRLSNTQAWSRTDGDYGTVNDMLSDGWRYFAPGWVYFCDDPSTASTLDEVHQIGSAGSLSAHPITGGCGLKQSNAFGSTVDLDDGFVSSNTSPNASREPAQYVDPVYSDFTACTSATHSALGTSNTIGAVLFGDLSGPNGGTPPGGGAAPPQSLDDKVPAPCDGIPERSRSFSGALNTYKDDRAAWVAGTRTRAWLDGRLETLKAIVEQMVTEMNAPTVSAERMALLLAHPEYGTPAAIAFANEHPDGFSMADRVPRPNWTHTSPLPPVYAAIVDACDDWLMAKQLNKPLRLFAPVVYDVTSSFGTIFADQAASVDTRLVAEPEMIFGVQLWNQNPVDIRIGIADDSPFARNGEIGATAVGGNVAGVCIVPAGHQTNCKIKTNIDSYSAGGLHQTNLVLHVEPFTSPDFTYHRGAVPLRFNIGAQTIEAKSLKLDAVAADSPTAEYAYTDDVLGITGSEAPAISPDHRIRSAVLTLRNNGDDTYTSVRGLWMLGIDYPVFDKCNRVNSQGEVLVHGTARPAGETATLQFGFAWRPGQLIECHTGDMSPYGDVHESLHAAFLESGDVMDHTLSVSFRGDSEIHLFRDVARWRVAERNEERNDAPTFGDGAFAAVPENRWDSRFLGYLPNPDGSHAPITVGQPIRYAIEYEAQDERGTRIDGSTGFPGAIYGYCVDVPPGEIETATNIPAAMQEHDVLGTTLAKGEKFWCFSWHTFTSPGTRVQTTKLTTTIAGTEVEVETRATMVVTSLPVEPEPDPEPDPELVPVPPTDGFGVFAVLPATPSTAQEFLGYLPGLDGSTPDIATGERVRYTVQYSARDERGTVVTSFAAGFTPASCVDVPPAEIERSADPVAALAEHNILNQTIAYGETFWCFAMLTYLPGWEGRRDVPFTLEASVDGQPVTVRTMAEVNVVAAEPAGESGPITVDVDVLDPAGSTPSEMTFRITNTSLNRTVLFDDITVAFGFVEQLADFECDNGESYRWDSNLRAVEFAPGFALECTVAIAGSGDFIQTTPTPYGSLAVYTRAIDDGPALILDSDKQEWGVLPDFDIGESGSGDGVVHLFGKRARPDAVFFADVDEFDQPGAPLYGTDPADPTDRPVGVDGNWTYDVEWTRDPEGQPDKVVAVSTRRGNEWSRQAINVVFPKPGDVILHPEVIKVDFDQLDLSADDAVDDDGRINNLRLPVPFDMEHNQVLLADATDQYPFGLAVFAGTDLEAGTRGLLWEATADIVFKQQNETASTVVADSTPFDIDLPGSAIGRVSNPGWLPVGDGRFDGTVFEQVDSVIDIGPWWDPEINDVEVVSTTTLEGHLNGQWNFESAINDDLADAIWEGSFTLYEGKPRPVGRWAWAHFYAQGNVDFEWEMESAYELFIDTDVEASVSTRSWIDNDGRVRVDLPVVDVDLFDRANGEFDVVGRDFRIEMGPEYQVNLEMYPFGLYSTGGWLRATTGIEGKAVITGNRPTANVAGQARLAFEARGEVGFEAFDGELPTWLDWTDWTPLNALKPQILDQEFALGFTEREWGPWTIAMVDAAPSAACQPADRFYSWPGQFRLHLDTPRRVKTLDLSAATGPFEVGNVRITSDQVDDDWLDDDDWTATAGALTLTTTHTGVTEIIVMGDGLPAPGDVLVCPS